MSTTLGRAGRVGVTILVIVAVQTLVCAAAAFPIVLAWLPLVYVDLGTITRVALFALAAVPSYFGFALLLMAISPLANWLTRARTPDGIDLRLADLDWTLMRWARYLAATHLVRVLAGPLFRGSPIWTAYLRLSGARIGRRVYVNTLAMSDYNLLELGNDVVIGDAVHVSGHTVEGGRLRTGRVTIGSGVTIGLGSVIDIDVEIGAGCQIGALSLIPKHTRIMAPGIYAGIPARLLNSVRGAGSEDPASTLKGSSRA